MVVAPRRPVLAVYGGSFDPPHTGHVMVPTWLRSQAGVDAVLVCPCFEHALDKALSPFETRLGWVRLAMGVHGGWLTVSDLERHLAQDADARGGAPVGSSLALLEAVASRYPDHAVRLVVGSDIIETGETARWHRWETLERRFSPIVVPRAGYGDQPGALPEISSARVRAALTEVPPPPWIHDVVPPQVLARLTDGGGDDRTAPVLVVGSGNAGTHLVSWLRGKGHDVRHRGARALLEAPSDPAVVADAAAASAVWLLGRDAQIAGLGRALMAAGLPTSTPILHGAGAVPSGDVEGLAACREAGHPVGTLHPICALRAELSPGPVEEAFFGIEGDARAVAWGHAVVGEDRCLDLSGLDAHDRRRYHGACALAANHVAALEGLALDELSRLGLPRDVGTQAMRALMVSSMDTLRRLGFPRGVTGPVSRGDDAGVARHLAALSTTPAEVYAVLSDALKRRLAAAADRA